MNMQNESSTSALNALHSLSPSPSLEATEVELQIELFIAKCQKVLPNKNRVQLEPICDFILSIAYNSPEQTFSVCVLTTRFDCEVRVLRCFRSPLNDIQIRESAYELTLNK